MGTEKPSIIIVILMFLVGIIRGVMQFFQNKQAQEEKKKVEESAEIQLQQSEQQAKQELQANLDTINSSSENDWEEWKKQVSKSP